MNFKKQIKSQHEALKKLDSDYSKIILLLDTKFSILTGKQCLTDSHQNTVTNNNNKPNIIIMNKIEQLVGSIEILKGLLKLPIDTSTKILIEHSKRIQLEVIEQLKSSQKQKDKKVNDPINY